MKKRLWPVVCLMLSLCLCLGLTGCVATLEEPPVQDLTLVEVTVAPSPAPSPTPAPEATSTTDPKGNTESLEEKGSYDSLQDVALYIQTYGALPDNYITKNQAEALGWSGGSVEEYAPGKCIGGDRFGNREGLLPRANGRTWTECDIDTLGENGRGAKRLVFSNDGLIYYTDDHYESFERVYPEEYGETNAAR